MNRRLVCRDFVPYGFRFSNLCISEPCQRNKPIAFMSCSTVWKMVDSGAFRDPVGLRLATRVRP